ncbi:aspartate aminotransferase family protein [Jatrophihabitans endophyticus]|uniref:aspartate aminotransferase family protein n=1 Tax=Jatrophihabitans endophyticus TaxID=1206085 RepID=UPI0026EA2D49|nr:aspartate aminotransferase family protein [Jatrophihabitans endophyticus]
MGTSEAFRLADVLKARGDERYDLHSRYLNPQLPRMLHAIGFDRHYVRGEGAYLYDAADRDYLDMLSGFGVFALGRHHPVIRDALHEVLDLQLPDLTQFDAPALAGPLAERLLSHVPHLDRVYFGNSGTEAVEAALKFARYHTGRGRVLYCRSAFHGLTAGSLSANGGKDFRKGFGPLLPGGAVPFGDLAALERELARGDVAALLVEPVQGKGVAVSPPGYLAGAAERLHAAGALLIADEVQCGLGRTGEFFAFQHDGVEPDLVATAKALSGGYVPVGATLGREEIFAKVYSSMDRVLVHDSTFGSNAQAMAAGLATLHVLENEDVIENSRVVGAELKRRLTELAERYEMISDVRGRGLMIGIEFGRPSEGWRQRGHWTALQLARKGLFAQTVVHGLFHRHRILTQVSGDHIEVIKLIPPLIIGEAEVDRVVAAFDDVMAEAHRGAGLTRQFASTLVASRRR